MHHYRRFLRSTLTANVTIAVEVEEQLEQGGGSMAPIFFQASLIPYLLFLYFLRFPKNRIPRLANFGFQFLLLFVVATAVAGVLAQKMFDSSLANIDWLHGSTESLLTVSNILIVVGFQNVMSRQNVSAKSGILAAVVATLCLVAYAFYGATSGFQEHDHFLWGIGNIHQDFPWSVRDEPENALSIATWMIHGMSVIEYVVAMGLVWRFADATGNPKWKGLTWGMMPNHASSICAVTHHFFYNHDQLLFLVTTQAFFTMLGSITTMIAAFRIAKSNGWTFLSQRRDTEMSSRQLQLLDDPINNSLLLLKLVCFTVLLSYVIKYGELGFHFPATPNVPLALTSVFAIPLMTAFFYVRLSWKEHAVDCGETQRLLENAEPRKSNGTFR